MKRNNQCFFIIFYILVHVDVPCGESNYDVDLVFPNYRFLEHFQFSVLLLISSPRYLYQVNKGVLLMEGEEEALTKKDIKYYTLMPERAFKEGSAAQLHFRLAESQFYRLLSGAYGSQYVCKWIMYVWKL